MFAYSKLTHIVIVLVQRAQSVILVAGIYFILNAIRRVGIHFRHPSAFRALTYDAMNEFDIAPFLRCFVF